jgi:hypothetical protein
MLLTLIIHVPYVCLCVYVEIWFVTEIEAAYFFLRLTKLGL